MIPLLFATMYLAFTSLISYNERSRKLYSETIFQKYVNKIGTKGYQVAIALVGWLGKFVMGLT
ncbi:hypothetical protein CLI91_15275 [Lentilactobacillus hilgardii]|nr:hypothetical protein [Lentilactobacillus hilgardii]MBZ2205605.1 hypothetical protein [Lentilactobacillus hilgardii]